MFSQVDGKKPFLLMVTVHTILQSILNNLEPQLTLSLPIVSTTAKIWCYIKPAISPELRRSRYYRWKEHEILKILKKLFACAAEKL